MKYLYLAFLLLLLSCSTTDTKKDLEFDIYNMDFLDYMAYVTNEQNNELSKLATETSDLRLLVENTLDTITQLQEFVIEITGSLPPDGNKDLRTRIINPEKTYPSSLVRDNQLGVTKDYFNRVTNYINNNGMNVAKIAKDEFEDGYYPKDPNLNGMDFFDLAFDKRNLYQTITMLARMKMDILYLERRFIQAQLKEQLGNENDL